jgi:hypothetical protein
MPRIGLLLHLYFTMKKFLFALSVLVFCGTAAAQDHPHEFNLFLGGFNSQYLGYSVAPDYSTDLYALYEPQTQISTGPVYTLDYNYAVLKWLSVGVQFHYSNLNVRTRTRIDSSYDAYQSSMFSFLPEVKLRIPSSAHFRLYGKAAAGMYFVPQMAPRFAYDLVPIGCEWAGQRVYGTAELVYGNVVKGGRIGVGFRF